MTRQERLAGFDDPNAPASVAQSAARDAAQISAHAAADRERPARSGAVAALVSLIALAFSAFSLWTTSLKPADLAVFVPPVIHFSQPYNNTNFEVIEVPVTIANMGAEAGTVVAMNLAVTDPRTGGTKLFYAASLGRWSMDQVRALALKPFAPVSVPGNASHSDTVLFYTRGDDQKPDAMIRETGSYNFELSIVTPAGEAGLIDRMLARRSERITFERQLKSFDARAFNQGTLPLYAPDWSAASNAGG